MRVVIALFVAWTGLGLQACVVNQPQQASGTELTAGLVQKEIHVGMPGDEVAMALGSPNIVSSDGSGNAVWIYDRISSSVQTQSSSSYGTLLLIGGSSSRGNRETSQNTFTVVIKFDEANLVREFAYHSSRF